jgi:hypothetical protein
MLISDLVLGSIYIRILDKAKDIVEESCVFKYKNYILKFDRFYINLTIYFYYDNLCFRIMGVHGGGSGVIKIMEKTVYDYSKVCYYSHVTSCEYKEVDYNTIEHAKIIWYAFKQIINNLNIDL